MALTETQHKVLKKLIQLRSRREPIEYWCGICDNLPIPGEETRQTLYPLFKQWPEYSGDLAYPVPSYDRNLAAHEAYLFANNLWDEGTAYGQARWRLLDYLITELEKELS